MAGKIIPVIMCGGAGTRLWPVSRESMPKQFVPIVGGDSTFQQVIAGVSDPELFSRPIVVTSSEFRFVVAEQLRDGNVGADIVLEPVRRDSGPAVAVSALLAFERDAEALVLVLASDHVVRKLDEFRATCRCAAAVAAQGRIVTFGIPPTCAATNYGYIRPGKRLNGASVHEVEAFVEKPDAATAAKYVADHYFWNSGNFLFHAATMWQGIEHLEPLMAQAAKAAVAGATRDLDFLRLAPEDFARAPKKTIDYAAMERTRRGAGGAAGVRASRGKAEEVKGLVEQLKAQNHRAATEHRRIYRPWGYYQDVDIASRYRVKRIVVKPGSKLSLQKHFHRSEHWVVVQGTAEVTVQNEARSVHENESMYIPIGSVHRLANPGKIPLELIEVQVGSYLGEDDIVRLDDVYGRQ